MSGKGASAMHALDEVQKHAHEWPGVQKLTVVQGILDRNKLLIAEIQRNHELRNPDALQRNVTLIRELNNNISRVVQTYQEVSSCMDESAPATSNAPPQPASSSMQTA